MTVKSCVITSLRKARRKLGGNRGVSLVEMLLCVLILLLSTGVTVSTLDLGITHFKARTRETEQRLLCNTLSLALQEHLTYANKIELNDPASPGELPTLKRFKTGSISALEGRWFEFVTGMYHNEGSLLEGAAGQIAIKYSRDGTNKYYMLADKSQYIVKRNDSNDVKLEATLAVKVDKPNKRFNVTIEVRNLDNVRTQETKSEFIVIPIHSGVFD